MTVSRPTSRLRWKRVFVAVAALVPGEPAAVGAALELRHKLALPWGRT